MSLEQKLFGDFEDASHSSTSTTKRIQRVVDKVNNMQQNDLQKITRRRGFQQSLIKQSGDMNDMDDMDASSIENALEGLLVNLPSSKSGRERVLGEKLSAMSTNQLNVVQSFMRQNYSAAHTDLLQKAISNITKDRRKTKMSNFNIENTVLSEDLSQINQLSAYLQHHRGS
jgi:hypothetical protein